MRLPVTEHLGHPWLIYDLAHDFDLVDVWRLPIAGEEGDLGSCYATLGGLDLAKDEASGASRWLFRLRKALGRWFGWDREINTLPIPGCEETTLRDRVPEQFKSNVLEPAPSDFQLVYQTHREFALEVSNGTVHAIMHVGWLPGGDGTFHAQMGVYAKTRGALGTFYMWLIAPFRHLVVYPALMRRIGRAWVRRGVSKPPVPEGTS